MQLHFSRTVHQQAIGNVEKICLWADNFCLQQWSNY